jgi:L-gulonolactone oxidase
MALYRDQQVTGQAYLVRATSQGFVSHNNLSCACAGAPAEVRTIAIDMSGMNKVLEVNEDRETITVQAGISFEALERALLEFDLSLPGMVVAPPLGSMTLGAAIATSAHGSSLEGPASIAAYLHSALMVDGTGARGRAAQACVSTGGQGEAARSRSCAETEALSRQHTARPPARAGSRRAPRPQA